MQLLSLSALLLSSSLAAAEFYEGTSVLGLNSKNFKSLVLDTNHLTLVEFYAPWCGYCKQLTPDYIKAAKNLAGVAKIAAINCDEEANKPICGQYDVKGFPTLKVFGPKPSKKKASSSAATSELLDDYTGPRTSKGITETMLYRFNAHGGVKTLSNEKGLSTVVKDSTKTRVILIPGKKHGSKPVPVLFRSLSIDFKADDVVFAFCKADLVPQLTTQLKLDKDSLVTEKSKLLVIPAGKDTAEVYEGSMKRKDVEAYLAKFAKHTDPISRKTVVPVAGKSAKSAKKPAGGAKKKAKKAKQTSTPKIKVNKDEL